MTDQIHADDLAANYIKLRDFKAKVKAEYDEKLAKIDDRMEAIEAQMMTFLNQTGQESSKTAAGTFFKTTKTSAKVADRDIFMDFVFLNDGRNFLESRVNKTAVDEYIEVHGKLPPGVDVTRVVSISVNRPKARG